MSRLRSYAPMNRRSAKAEAEESSFRAVYRAVALRSEGRCEWREAIAAPPMLVRCRKRATDKHHTVKPRRSHHVASLVIDLCRGHHDRCEWPFARGRAVVTATGDGAFRCEVRYSSDKFRAPSSVGRAQ